MGPKSRTSTLRFLIVGDAKGPNGAQTAMRTVSVEADGLAAKAKKVAGLFAAGAVVEWGRQTIQTYRTVGGEMLKIQRLTGASDQAASGIWVAAQQSGVAVDKLTSSVAIFQSKLQKGQLDKYGLGLTDATGKAVPFEEALRRISDRFQGMDDASEKVDLARSLFGKSGADLIPLLNKGGAALDEYIAKAEDLGLTLNSDDIKEATKNQRDFQLATTSAGFVIGKELLPAATAFTSWAAAELPRVVGWVSAVGDAIGSLPDPLKLVLGALVLIGPAAKVLDVVATPFEVIGSAVKGGSEALEMFRYGLAGITQPGAGAANMLGSLTAAAAANPVATGAALAGVVALGYGLVHFATDADRSAEAAKNLAEEAARLGTTTEEVFRKQLARSIAGVDGGIEGLSGKAKYLAVDLATLGANTGSGLAELNAALFGSEEAFDSYISAIEKKAAAQTKAAKADGDYTAAEQDETARRDRAIAAIREMRAQTSLSVTESQKLADAEAALGIETSDTADATDGATGALDRHTSALDRANTAVTNLRRRQKEISDAEQSVADAHTASRDAQDDLAAARRAATRDSDEYRDAAEDVRSAEQSVSDAQEQVAEAQRSRTDAVRDLSDAIDGAKDRLREMAQATRDAALAEEEANLKVKESRQELERKARDPRASALERERAALELKKAQEAARQAGEDNAAQQAANAAAQAAGVNGDREVIRARQAVADANRAVIDAERGVSEAVRDKAAAEKRAAKVISDARAEVAAAAKRSEDAVIKEADAWAALAEAQHGPLAGAQAYRDFLTNLTKDLDPNSPLSQRVARLLADVDRAIALARIVQSGTTTPPTRDPDAGLPTSDGANSRSSDERAGGDTYNLEVNQTLQGTTTQQARQARASATDALDDFAKGAR